MCIRDRVIGAQEEGHFPMIEPTLKYRVILPEGTDPAQAMQKLIQLKDCLLYTSRCV